jgi:hypothetical protein
VYTIEQSVISVRCVCRPGRVPQCTLQTRIVGAGYSSLAWSRLLILALLMSGRALVAAADSNVMSGCSIRSPVMASLNSIRLNLRSKAWGVPSP